MALRLSKRRRCSVPTSCCSTLGLPKLNGYDAGRRLRQQPWGKNMVLVALTGWGQDEDRRQSKEAGFDHHMVKPLDLGRVMKLLASLPRNTGAS